MTAVRNIFAVSTNTTVSKPTAVVGVILSGDNSRDNVILKSPDIGQQTSNRFQGVQSNVKLSPTVDMLEHERQELACKKQSSTGNRKHGAEIANKKLSATERQENTNNKTTMMSVS